MNFPAFRESLPKGVNLLAVSKGQPVSKIRSLAVKGQVDFGESRVQEALAKLDSLKDLNDIKGVLTTQGSELFRDYCPKSDDNIVACMRKNGAVFPGKTNVPEHGFGATTTNILFGSTNNPYDLSKSCGASSGGTAAAIAAEMVPLAMGSDFAGSLRTPASFCNIVGMRPSVGFVPTSRRGMGWSPFDVEGPMAKNVTDLKILLSGMVSECNLDPIPNYVNKKSELCQPPKKNRYKKIKNCSFL